MADRKSPGRYCFIRGHQALWKGDPAVSGSQFRQVVITSNDWNSTEGTFQVYAVEGTGLGMAESTMAGAQEPSVLFDSDFEGLEPAGRKFTELVAEAKALGYSVLALFDELDFQTQLKEQSRRTKAGEPRQRSKRR